MRRLLPFLLFLSADGAGGAPPPPKADDKTPPKADEKPPEVKPDATAAELAELRSWKAAKEAADKKAADDALAAKGEHEKLANQFKAEAEAAKAELETFRKAEKVRQAEAQTELEAELKTLPKEVADLIPAGTASERLSWLKKAQKAGVLGGAEKPAGTRTQGGGGGDDASKVPADVKQYAEERGLDPVAYYKSTQKRGGK